MIELYLMIKVTNTVKVQSLLCVIILFQVNYAFGKNIFTQVPQIDSSWIELVGQNGDHLTFNRVTSGQKGEHGFSWSGKTQNKSGFLTFAYVGGRIRGTVVDLSSSFQFKGTLHEQEIFSQSSKHRPCGGCKFDASNIRDPRSAAQSKHSWRQADAGQIDLMVVYPTAVLNVIGSKDETIAEIENAVAGANLCFRNSDVQVQLRLVHTFETSYSPTGNLDVDLDRLTKQNDGYLEDVHSKRDQYGADIVTLLSTDSSMGGLANTLSFPTLSFEESAFNVCVWDQIGAPSYTLAHEIGHNLGCLHNREDASGSGQGVEYDYGTFSYGKRWITNGEGYRTVMSYDDSARNYDNAIPYFSNPSISYLGETTGNAGSEDNAKVLSISSSYASNFRDSKIQGILPSLYAVSINEGNYTSLGVRLACPPTDEVVVNLSLSNSTDFLLGSSANLSFNKNNWNLSQPVLLIASRDSNSDDDTGVLSFSANGLDSVGVNLLGSDFNNQDPDTSHFLSGVIANPYGVAMHGVSLNFSTNQNSLVSDQNGSFFEVLESGYSGVITPSKSGFSFSPSSISIDNLSADFLGNHFVGTRSSILYVDHEANGLNDGTSWNNAFNSLTDALELVDSFSEIWVAAGTYYPASVRSGSFVIPGDITVFGGFSGNEVSSMARDISQNETILSGDIGVQGIGTDNSFHVVVALDGAVLDGFTIQDGNATENYSDDRGLGGGLWAEGSSFNIRNCKFENNWAFQGGGAVWLKNVSGVFSNCTFSANASGSTGSGGAAWIADSNLTIESCTFSSNRAGFWGGAIRADSCILKINGTNFLQNQSTVSNGGGAVYLKEGNFSITTSTFLSNQSIHEGGAILLDETNGTLSDSNFTDNLNSGSNGGGAIFIESTDATISNCDFIRNKTNANNHGGALKLVSSSPVIQGCDFQYNQSTFNSGGALFIDETSNPTITANEFSYNSSASWGGAVYSKNASLSINGGLVMGNWSRFGGGIATLGVERVILTNIKVFANEANSSSDAQGGFLFLGTGATESKMINCVMAGNKSSFRNGVLSTKGEVRFVNCTLYGNQATDSGGISLLFSGDSLIFKNSILWANTDSNGYEIYINSGSASAEYSLVKPGDSPSLIQGSGLVFSDPAFVDINGLDDISGTADDDFTLLSNSPAIDGGVTSFTNYKSTDISGRTRDSSPDMGAYEYYINTAPTFVGSTSYSVMENNTTITDLNATDADGDNLTYSLVGGADQSSFSIDATSGELSFKTAPDFNQAGDIDSNNIYEVRVNVTDGILTDEVVLKVTVEDINTAPTFVGSTSYSVMENNTTITDLNATDADGDNLTYSLVGGADQSSFSIDATSGELSFNTAPDFEYPDDSDGNNSYNVILEITDGYLTDRSTLLITVTDINESAVSAESVILLVHGFKLEGSWMEATWFGAYYSKFFPWVYHTDLGWLYIVQAKSGETWMWHHSLGWLWTDNKVFPYFYINKEMQWAFAGSDLQSGKYYFYKPGEEGWVDVE